MSGRTASFHSERDADRLYPWRYTQLAEAHAPHSDPPERGDYVPVRYFDKGGTWFSLAAPLAAAAVTMAVAVALALGETRYHSTGS